jgi:hypothetical protein
MKFTVNNIPYVIVPTYCMCATTPTRRIHRTPQSGVEVKLRRPTVDASSSQR